MNGTPATAPAIYCWSEQVACVRPFLRDAGIYSPLHMIGIGKAIENAPTELIFFALTGFPLPIDIRTALDARKARVCWIEHRGKS